MEEFLQAMEYKKNNDKYNYYIKINESIVQNYSLAYHELAEIYSIGDIVEKNLDTALSYLNICKMLISHDDIILAEKMKITFIDDSDLSLLSLLHLNI